MSEGKNIILEKLARGAFVIFLGTILGSLFNYLTRIIIARFLGPSSYGILSLGLSILGFMSIISLFGLRESIARYISFYLGKGDKKITKRIVVTGLKISLPIAVIISFLTFIFSKNISLFFQEPGLVPIIKIFSIALPFYVALDIFISATRGLQNTKYKVYSYDIFLPIMKFSLVGLLIYMGYNLVQVGLAHMLAIILTMVLAFFLLNKIFPIFKIKIKKNFPIKKLFLFSWPLMITTVMFLVINWTDVLMLGYFKPSRAVGIYESALPTASMLTIILSSFNYLFMPTVSEMFSKKRINDLKETYKTITRWIFIFSLPILLLILIFSKPILGTLFGSEYTSASFTLSILALGYFYVSFVGPSGNILISIGRPKSLMIVVLTTGILNFILNYFLIQIVNPGFLGAGIALSLSFFIGQSLSLVFVYRYISTHPFTSKYFSPLIFSIIAGSVAYFLYRTLSKTIILFIIEGIIFFSIYLLGLFYFKGLSDEDLNTFLKIVKKT